MHSLYLFVCRFIWWDNCLKRSLSGTNSEDNGSWSDDVSVLGPVLDAGVGLQTIGSFKSFVTILAHVARAGQVCLHMLLHVLLGSVTVATMDANKLSVHSPLKHGMYLLFIRAWIPSWKYTSLLRLLRLKQMASDFIGKLIFTYINRLTRVRDYLWCALMCIFSALLVLRNAPQASHSNGFVSIWWLSMCLSISCLYFPPCWHTPQKNVLMPRLSSVWRSISLI